VERLLAKDPDERYASTRDAAHELRALSTQIAANTSADSLWSIRHFPPARRTRKRKPILVASAIAVIVLGALGYTMWRFIPRESAQDKKYIALTRFRDLSGDPNGQYVVDGLAETLSSRLAHFPDVQVIRPTKESVASTDAKQVAKDLGANIVLVGSMQRVGDQVRVGYTVVDIASGSERAGDLIDGPISELFSIEDRLASSVASALQLGPTTFHVPAADAKVSRERFLEALGRLRRHDSEQSVNAAIGILQQLAAQSNSASVQAALGRAYLYKFTLAGDPKYAMPAVAASERAVAADPHNPDVHLILGDVRRATGKYDEAIAEYKATLAQEPNNVDAILGMGDTYTAAGKVKEAEAAYKTAADLQPYSWDSYSKLGHFYFNQGRYQDAAALFEKVIKLVPDNVRAYNNLGGAYEAMARYDDAVRIFKRSIAMNPTDIGYSNLGTCYYYLGRFSEAAAAFEKATSLAPSRYSSWINLGDAYRWAPGSENRAAGAYDEAIRLANEELRLNPANAAVRARLAECLAKRGKIGEAKNEIGKALTADPSNVRIMFRAAVVQNACGDTDASLLWLKKAINAGYSLTEAQRDPEFALLRQTDGYKRAFGGVQ